MISPVCVATNIGVHFYDSCCTLYSAMCLKMKFIAVTPKQPAGFLEYERARVRWFLSIDANLLPENAIAGEKDDLSASC